jgi:hypothetical protein
LYGSIYKCINNSSYQDVSSKINLNFIENNINNTISKTAFINKKNSISSNYFLNINNFILEYIFTTFYISKADFKIGMIIIFEL